MKPSSPAGSPPTPDLVPGFDLVLEYFIGAALVMAGRPDGLRRFDLSPDGFWQSFSALIVALPPIVLSWVEFEDIERSGPSDELGFLQIYGAHAFADILAWFLPILILMLTARHIGYRRKIVPLVVASNWGGALLSWLFAPYWLLVMLFGRSEIIGVIGTIVTFATIILTGRLIYFSTGRDLMAAIGVTVLMIVCSLLSYGAVMDVTGVPLV